MASVVLYIILYNREGSIKFIGVKDAFQTAALAGPIVCEVSILCHIYVAFKNYMYIYYRYVINVYNSSFEFSGNLRVCKGTITTVRVFGRCGISEGYEIFQKRKTKQRGRRVVVSILGASKARG